jgi:PEP-CTERM motif
VTRSSTVGGLLLSGAVYASLLATISPASAEILVEESFAHADGNLIGQLPAPGPGAIWAAHLDEGNTPIQVFEGMAVLQQGKGSGGREDANVRFARQPATGTTFARFDFCLPADANGDVENLDAEGSNFAHLKSNNLTNHFRARTGIVAPADGGDFALAINANGSRLNEGTAWGTDLSFDTIYRVVVSWDAGTGESKLWLNPTSELSLHISHIGHSTGQRIESFALRQSSDYTGIQLIDNLVVATTFAEAQLGRDGGFGDYNVDGTVDAADYVVWRKDPNRTQGQYDLWRAHFGQPAGSNTGTSANAAVPEPASALLLLMGLMAACARRRAAVP